MSKLIKILAGIVVVLLIIVVGGVMYLKSMDFNQYKGMIAEQAKAATGRDLVIAGDLAMEVSLNPALSVEGVTFANASWGSRPEMVKLKKFSAELSLMPLLSGTVDVKRVVLQGLDLLAETDKAGKGNWEFAKAEKEAEKEVEKVEAGDQVLPVVREVVIEDVKVTYKDGAKGETTALAVDRLTVKGEGVDSPLAIDLAATFNGIALAASGELGAPAVLIAGGKPYPVKLDAQALGATVGVDGQIADPKAAKGIAMAITAKVPNLADTLKAAAKAVPALADAGPVPAVPIDFAGTVKDVTGGYGVEGMVLKLGTSDLSGNVAADLSGKRPKVDATLASKLLDVDALLPKGEGKAAPPPAEPAKKDDGRVFPADPLPLDGLKAADANLKFTGAKIVASGMEVTNVDLTLKLANGKLAITPLKAEVSGGKVTQNVTLDASRKVPSLAAKLDVKQLDYGALLTTMGQGGLLTGKVDTLIDVKGSGSSVRAIMASLDGKTRIHMGKGRVESDALAIVTGSFLNAIPGVDKLLGGESAKDLRCGYVNFDIAKGQAKASTVLIETGNMAVITTGNVDLAQEKPKLRIDPRVKDTAIASLAIPINIEGTLANPDPTPDAAAVAGGVAKTVGTVGTAVATGGVSLLVGALADKAVDAAVADDTDYCALAAAGKPLEPVKKKEAAKEPAKEGAASASGSAAKKEEGGVAGAVKGIGGALGGLFGGKD